MAAAVRFPGVMLPSGLLYEHPERMTPRRGGYCDRLRPRGPFPVRLSWPSGPSGGFLAHIGFKIYSAACLQQIGDGFRRRGQPDAARRAQENCRKRRRPQRNAGKFC